MAINKVEEYINTLLPGRKEAVSQLRQTIIANLPKGFQEEINGGMISYVVPHAVYPAGYHCNPKLPLPFIAIASQKNFIALHHLGLYSSPALLQWFTETYPKYNTTKLDMGKGCVRFKKPDQIPYALVKELAKKMSPQQWIEQYESVYKRK